MDDATIVNVSIAIFSVLVTTILLSIYYLTRREKGATRSVDISSGIRREESGDRAAMDNGKVLNPATFQEMCVLTTRKVSHHTKLIRIEIPHGKSLDLPIGRHISIRAEIDGKYVIRPYTPTSRTDQKGYFDILVKTYELGKMSPRLFSLKPGDKMEVRGPIGRFRYAKNSFKVMGLIAGGTGLTPCLQVMRCLLEGPEASGDNTCFVLLFQNRSEQDILLREDLDSLVSHFPQRVAVHYFLSNPSTDDWGSSAKSLAACERRGYINKAAMQALISPAVCQFVGLCGPSGFNDCMKALVLETGHSEEATYVW